MKKLLLLCLILLGGVMQVSATDYSIGASEGSWTIKGQMTDNGDGTYSYIINLPANYTNYLFTIFEGTSINSDWSNAYHPYTNGDWNVIGDYGIQYNPRLVKHNNYEGEQQITNGTISFTVGANNCYGIKVTFNPTSGNCDIQKLVAISSAYNNWGNTDYLYETEKDSKIYSGNAPILGGSANADGFKIVSIESNNIVKRGYKNDNGEWLSNDNTGVVNGTVENDGVYTLTANYNTYAWVAPVRVTVPASVATYGMGTISSQYALDFTGADGINAYAITGVSGNALTLSDRITGKVPANTGLYIEGTANADIPTTIYTTALGVTNYMVAGTGEKVEQTVTIESTGYTNFILTTNKGASETPKFYKVNSAGMTVPAGKAYLQIPTPIAGARDYFWFGDETTGIANVDVNANVDANAPMYNLAGQRVSKNYKGVVIQNGKKMLMK